LGFFSNLTGGDSRRDVRRAKAASDRLLTEGYEGADARYDEAYGEYEPYASGGSAAQTRYNQLLGLGTPEERTAAQQTYLSDDMFGASLNQQSNALLRQLNARGNTYGGKAALAGARVGLENYNQYLNRLQGQGQSGMQAANARAGIRSGQGDMLYGYKSSLAGNEINAGNAIAGTRNTGINNLLGVGETAMKAAVAFSDIRLKEDIERVGTLPSGLPVYEFAYIGQPERYRGVMAHEAAEKFPASVVYSPEGYAMVDYAMIG